MILFRSSAFKVRAEKLQESICWASNGMYRGGGSDEKILKNKKLPPQHKTAIYYFANIMQRTTVASTSK